MEARRRDDETEKSSRDASTRVAAPSSNKCAPSSVGQLLNYVCPKASKSILAFPFFVLLSLTYLPEIIRALIRKFPSFSKFSAEIMIHYRNLVSSLPHGQFLKLKKCSKNRGNMPEFSLILTSQQPRQSYLSPILTYFSSEPFPGEFRAHFCVDLLCVRVSLFLVSAHEYFSTLRLVRRLLLLTRYAYLSISGLARFQIARTFHLEQATVSRLPYPWECYDRLVAQHSSPFWHCYSISKFQLQLSLQGCNEENDSSLCKS